jgi:hypothetical protein
MTLLLAWFGDMHALGGVYLLPDSVRLRGVTVLANYTATFDQARLIQCLADREGTVWFYQDLAAELTVWNETHGRPGVVVKPATVAKAVQRLRERGVTVERQSTWMEKVAALEARIEVLERENAVLSEATGRVRARKAGLPTRGRVPVRITAGQRRVNTGVRRA